MEGAIIKGLLPSCPTVKFDPENLESAVAFVRMLLGQITPEAFLGTVMADQPHLIENAKLLVQACVGVVY